MSSPSTLREAVREARRHLEAAGIAAEEAARDADLLALHVLGWDRARLLAHDTDLLRPEPLARFEVLVARRGSREPISQIVGRREFWGLDFEVTPDVLTPRPETEILIEEALARLPDCRRHPLALADAGTGSGCLAICLARECPAALVHASDISEKALSVARRNAAVHEVESRIRFHHASLLDDIPGPLDLVVSNPPYIPSADILSLPVEVREHEPLAALDGGDDGLDLVRALLQQAAERLRPGGWLLFEFGYGQEPRVRQAAGDSRFTLVGIRADLQGIPRAALLQLP